MKAGRCAKRAAKWTGLAAVLLLLAFEASAQGQQPAPSDRSADPGPPPMAQGQRRPPRNRGDGGGPQGMAPATRPAHFAAGDGDTPRGGQMSREERRQLRRDVHEAGRDLYPERRRAGRHQQNPPQDPSRESVPVR